MAYHSKGETSGKIKGNEWKQSGGALGKSFGHVWKDSFVLKAHLLF